jgi:hypothetical protein
MTTWIIKFATDDPDRALANVAAQRSEGFTPWIEDGNGAAVDEQSLKTNGRGVETKRTLIDRMTGPLFVVGSVFAGLFVLYLIGLLIDDY